MKNIKLVSAISATILFMIPLNVEAYRMTEVITSLDDKNLYASNTTVDPYSKIPHVEGETSVGLQVVEDVPAETLAFEVPLYITTAVVDLEEEVLVPDNYGITNLSVGRSGYGVDMAVVGLTVTAKSTNDYWSYTDGTLLDNDEMHLQVGGISITVNPDEILELDLTDSVFYDKETKKFRVINYNEYLQIPIVGKVLAGVRTESGDSKAVAQFTLKYTVSLLDESKDPVGLLYEGAYPEGYILIQ